MSEAIQTKKSNRTTVFLLILVFTLPVILAKIALDTDFFQRKATNKGILLEPTLDFSRISESHSESNTDNQKKWRLVYTLPEQCDQVCENALYGIYQVWMALGKHMDRVSPLVVTTELSDKIKLASLTQETSYQILKSQTGAVQSVFSESIVGNIFVVDTLDNVVLRYLPNADKQEAIQHSREILSDMRKLLKLSRIG